MTVRGEIPAGARSLPDAAIVAHRGGATLVPENTLEGLHRMAFGYGFRYLELDCILLADGGLGLMHDLTIDRTTTGTGTTADLTTAEFRALTVDCSSWFDAAWSDTNPPLLDDVFRTIGRRAAYFIEGKNNNSCPAIAAMACRYRLRNHVIVYSFTSSEAAKAQAYGMQSCFVTDVDAASTNVAAGHSWIMGSTSVTDDYITNAIAAGLRVIIATVDTAVDYQAFAAKGVHAVLTNDPVTIAGG